MGPVRELAQRLIELPGVVAVTLGGSRAGGGIHHESGCDFGLYCRDTIRADDVRARSASRARWSSLGAGHGS
jgi:hypothetical protein